MKRGRRHRGISHDGGGALMSWSVRALCRGASYRALLVLGRRKAPGPRGNRLLAAMSALSILLAAGEPAHATAREAFAAQSAVSSFPLGTLPSGHVYVYVGIDGSAPRRFIIDTAASQTVITPKFQVEMPSLRIKSQDVPLDGAMGSMQVKTAEIDRVDVAGHVYRSSELILVPAGPLDRLGIDGVLGGDILSRLIVDLDMPARRWRMTSQSGVEVSYPSWSSHSFVLDDRRTPRLSVRLGDATIPAVLDTGASRTILNWAAANAIGVTREDAGLSDGPNIRGATSHSLESVEKTLDELAVGDAVMRSPSVQIADLPAFEMLGFEVGQPAIILGIDMFADRRLVIDYPCSRLHISGPASSTGAASR